MTLQVKSGTLMTTTGTANIEVTDLGFTPKALVLMGARISAEGTHTGAQLAVGCATGAANRFSIGSASEDNVNPADAISRVQNNGCFLGYTTTIALDGILDFVSFDSANNGGFTLIADDAYGTSRQVGYMALGGDSLTDAYAGTFILTTGTGNFSVSGLGFQPDCVIFFTSGITFDNTTGAHITIGFGGMTSTAQVTASAGSQDNVSPVNSRSITRTDRCATQASGSSDAEVVSLSYVSMDADGFTVYKHVSQANTRIGYLALKGGNYKVGSLNVQTSAGQFGVGSLGFKPSGLLMFSTMQATATETAVSTHAQLAAGFTDGTTQFSNWFIDEDGLTTSDSFSRQSNSKLLTRNGGYAGGFVTESEMELVSFDDNGFTLDQTDADSSGWLVGYIALGPGEATGGAPDQGLQAMDRGLVMQTAARLGGVLQG